MICHSMWLISNNSGVAGCELVMEGQKNEKQALLQNMTQSVQMLRTSRFDIVIVEPKEHTLINFNVPYLELRQLPIYSIDRLCFGKFIVAFSCFR